MGLLDKVVGNVVKEEYLTRLYFTRVGRDHLTDPDYWNSGCQDAFAFRECNFGSVIAVSDGSSSAFESKTGSCAAMRLVLNISQKLLARDPLPTPEEFTKLLQDEFLKRLKASIQPLAGLDGDITSIVEQAYYFTLLIGVVTADWSAVIGCGDGFYAINGNIKKIDSRPGNFPEYIGYLLCNPIPAGFEDVKLKVFETLPTEKLDSIFVATDGIGPVIRKKPGSTFSIEELLSKSKSPDQFELTRDLSFLAEDRVELSVIQTGQKLSVEPKLTKGRFGDDVTFISIFKNRFGKMPKDWSDYRSRNLAVVSTPVLLPQPTIIPTSQSPTVDEPVIAAKSTADILNDGNNKKPEKLPVFTIPEVPLPPWLEKRETLLQKIWKILRTLLGYEDSSSETDDTSKPKRADLRNKKDIRKGK